MSELLKIGDSDYSDYVVSGSLICGKEERGVVKNITLDGMAHKHRAALKDTVNVQLALVPDSVYVALVADVSALLFTATYRAQDGVVTKTCATDTGAVGSMLRDYADDGALWDSVSLTIYEV
jgi:hypothetical protein